LWSDNQIAKAIVCLFLEEVVPDNIWIDLDAPRAKTTKELEWLHWRKQGIGSSDAPVLMEVSPWKTLHQLWLEKTGQSKDEFTGNWATRRGQDLEPKARYLYNNKFNTNMEPANIELIPNPVFRASFDGIDYDKKRIIEIKCPGKASHQEALEGRIPKHYMPQLQWLMMVSGYNQIDYVSWDGVTDIVVVKVVANKAYQLQLTRKAIEFWGHVATNTPYQELWVESIDQLLLAMLKNYNKKKDQVKLLEIEMDALKARIKPLINSNTKCGEFKLQWINKKGSVDYSKIELLKNIDLDIYRKETVRYLSIVSE
jgi:putative phage-type endonuclease